MEPDGHCHPPCAPGNESCATDTGCVCESNEISCTNVDMGVLGVKKVSDLWRYLELLSAQDVQRHWPHGVLPSRDLADLFLEKGTEPEYYPNGCPLECSHDQMYCSIVSFDQDGLMLWEDYCEDGEANNWHCPVICKADSAQKCGTGFDEYCVSLGETCPVICEEQYCWTDNFAANGDWLSTTESCATWGEECPCGTEAVRCTDPNNAGDSWCSPTFYGCPLICNELTEKTCFPISYTPEGEFDWEAPATESCQNITRSCPCGANAKMCRWTDEFGLENEECFPTADNCPVTCTAAQQICWLNDYDAFGYPAEFREVCAPAGGECPCGSNAKPCKDQFGDTHCYPLVDWETNGAPELRGFGFGSAPGFSSTCRSAQSIRGR
ncbi:unnamed protein product [Symbiodinium sp. CCMP2592]|nr:unnamed protein product [Symbiodinium sp. CCMP2592]